MIFKLNKCGCGFNTVDFELLTEIKGGAMKLFMRSTKYERNRK